MGGSTGLARDRGRGVGVERTDEDADAAARAEPDVDARERQEPLAKVARGAGSGGRRDAGLGEPLSGEHELGVDVAGGKEAEMADLGEALGQDMQEKALEELRVSQGDGGVAAGAPSLSARV
jgi:hypothetical protein